MAHPLLVEATRLNSSFSQVLPGLQLAVDSTSLGESKQCDRKYYYSIVMGYQARSESVHLTWGIHIHRAREVYEHARSRKLDHETALREALHDALIRTWNRELNKPWASDHRTKNRLTLVRSIVWMLDEWQDDPLETLILANGKPAVELSFRFATQFWSFNTGERFELCGHLDRLARFQGENFIVDLKSTEKPIDANWWRKFTPFNQFSCYSIASKVAFGVPIKGLMVDGLQVTATFTKFQRGIVHRDDYQLAEWLHDTGRKLKGMEACAIEALSIAHEADPAAAWPQNDKACDMYGGCSFRSVCSRTPSERPAFLKAEFVQRIWDPLKTRGDI